MHFKKYAIKPTLDELILVGKNVFKKLEIVTKSKILKL